MVQPELVVERYLIELHRLRSLGAGTAETSYYPILRELLETVGASLKPKVQLPAAAER